MGVVVKVLVTGASGFVGRNLVPYLKERHWEVITLDAEPAPLKGDGYENHIQYRLGSYSDINAIKDVLSGVKVIIHLASQSHVDRSISGPVQFIDDNVRGTLELFEVARHMSLEKLVHFSTDEVGACLEKGSFDENYAFDCGSVYSASKGAQELLVQAYIKTYDLPIVTTRCVNIFGPHQADEKLIPTIIRRAVKGESVPIYGNGMQKRQWVSVEHVCEYVNTVASANFIPPKTLLHITGTHEYPNVLIAHTILNLLNKPSNLIEHVADRLGHDVRYSLGRTFKTDDFIDLSYKEDSFLEDLKKTVNWYRGLYE
jgi:dTDP-glucose 4,6-dehydratase